MSHKIRTSLRQALESLTGTDLEKFCFHLRDRRDEPKIRRGQVDETNPVKIVDLLVSKFTELGALKVVLETLRLIDCNQEAQTLESKTKACLDKSDPIFRKTSDGKLDRKPSQEAEFYAAGQYALKAAQKGRAPVTMKKPEEVEADAKAHVLSEGGDPGNDRLLLSRYVIQFGKYKGQNFKWLLENDVSYVAMLVAAHQTEQENSVTSTTTAQKVSLTKYAIPYREVLGEVRFHRGVERAKERSLQPGQEGEALVGFGIYKTETLKDLYESKNRGKISYVNFLRGKKSTCDPGSKMDAAIRYILQRDQSRASAATAPSRPFTRSFTRATRKRRSNRNQYASSSRPKVKRT
ncbi:uncharacterized protein LOC128449772 isoform X1 [Pleuronectes platessa]|uniref:uncharacterized protein LOC128449772 isoform X1 n=1 Tax=Pleuronectes platessa TaxID=8262 RepID=UPI00232A3779|nr:uncharacterized protein LOC128449772 isoform X1 [Pleuronectes platessa]